MKVKLEVNETNVKEETERKTENGKRKVSNRKET
jgi:hypothetical protein